jgi:hypothetical protein
MLLWCPECGERHVDEGEFADRPHHTHACQNCGHAWRPAIVPTVGVRFLPGFKNGEPAPAPVHPSEVAVLADALRVADAALALAERGLHAMQREGTMLLEAIPALRAARRRVGEALHGRGHPTEPEHDLRVQESRECERIVRGAMALYRHEEYAHRAREVLWYAAESLALRRRSVLGAGS